MKEQGCVLAYMCVYLLDLNKAVCCKVLHFTMVATDETVRTKFGGFMAEPLQVSHLPNLSPLHALRQVFKFWRTVITTYWFPCTFSNSFLCLLFVQLRQKIPCGGALLFLLQWPHVPAKHTECKAPLMLFCARTSCDSKKLPKPCLTHKLAQDILNTPQKSCCLKVFFFL